MMPSPLQRLSAQVGIAIIAAHDAGTARANLAALAGWDGIVVIVDALDFDQGPRRPDGGRPPQDLGLVDQRAGRASLGRREHIPEVDDRESLVQPRSEEHTSEPPS